MAKPRIKPSATNCLRLLLATWGGWVSPFGTLSSGMTSGSYMDVLMRFRKGLPDRPFAPYRPNTHWRTRVSIENFCQVTVTLKARNTGCSVWCLQARLHQQIGRAAGRGWLACGRPGWRIAREGMERSPQVGEGCTGD